MNLLLDTHAFLWAIGNPSNLSKGAREAIVDGNNIVFVSAVTAWEIAIKKGLANYKSRKEIIFRSWNCIALHLSTLQLNIPWR